MGRKMRGIAVVGIGVLLLAFFAWGGSRGLLAQDATPTGDEGTPEVAEPAATEALEEGLPPRPAHIHSGSCGDDLGDVVQPLNDLTEPATDLVGNVAATGAQNSFTTVPMALDDILADDHAINVHLSNEEIGTYVACGEVGGRLTDGGSLVIGLRELNDSDMSGVAVLTPNAADPTQTDVSAFVVEALAAEDAGLAEDLEGLTEEATEEGGEEATAEATPAP